MVIAISCMPLSQFQARYSGKTLTSKKYHHKTCKICQKKFVTTRKIRKTCSTSCSHQNSKLNVKIQHQKWRLKQ